MLRPALRTGLARLNLALVHVAILAAGLAGLAGFAVTMSEATPVAASVALEPPVGGRDAERSPAPEDSLAPARPVRVVYPRLGH